jgi:hypothetical protein
VATNPPINHLAPLTDNELLQIWQQRVTRLTDAINANYQTTLFPDSTIAFFDESVDRVEQEMGRRNMPIPGDKTWK